VYRSSYFKDEVDRQRHSPHPCYKKEVSFRTPEAMKQAADRSYHEQMSLCFSTHGRPLQSQKHESFLYISRAYRSNQVFVYRQDREDERIYLENLSYNISIFDELNSFDFVED